MFHKAMFGFTILKPTDGDDDNPTPAGQRFEKRCHA